MEKRTMPSSEPHSAEPAGKPASERPHAPPQEFLEAMADLARVRGGHEKAYAQAPLRQALELRSASRALKTLASRWREVDPAEHSAPVPLAAAEDINAPSLVAENGFMEGNGKPAEGASPPDFLGERHRIIGNDWQAACMSSLAARLIHRALELLGKIDFSPSALREDLGRAGDIPSWWGIHQLSGPLETLVRRDGDDLGIWPLSLRSARPCCSQSGPGQGPRPRPTRRLRRDRRRGQRPRPRECGTSPSSGRHPRAECLERSRRGLLAWRPRPAPPRRAARDRCAGELGEWIRSAPGLPPPRRNLRKRHEGVRRRAPAPGSSARRPAAWNGRLQALADGPSNSRTSAGKFASTSSSSPSETCRRSTLMVAVAA